MPASNLQQPFPTLPSASTFPNFIGTMLPGPPYTGDRTPLLVGFMDANFKEATTQHYGLEIQSQYKSYLFSLAYAGATGTHLAVIRGNNQPALASPSNPVNGLTTNSVANADERVPFPGIAPPVFDLRSDATSHYNSLQTTIERRFSHGLRFLAAYTLSKSIDTAGDSLGSSTFGFYGDPIFGEQTFNDQNNPALNVGLRILIADTGLCQLHLGTAAAGKPQQAVPHLGERLGHFGSRDAPIGATFHDL